MLTLTVLYVEIQLEEFRNIPGGKLHYRNVALLKLCNHEEVSRMEFPI